MFQKLKHGEGGNASAGEITEPTNISPGSTDITDPSNLDVTQASIEITQFDNQFPMHNPFQPVTDREQAQNQELDARAWLTVIDKLASHGVTDLTITGGEPTFKQQFRRILQYAIANIDNVTVQTNGATNRNLSDFDCTVSIPIEYPDPLNNNEVRRMTNPERYMYRPEHEELVDTEQNKSIPIQGQEQALQLAYEKAEKVDNPVVIRTNIYSNNNLLKIIGMAQTLDADIVFTPLYPVAQNQKLLEQVPAPKRFVEAMHIARDINMYIPNKVTIKSPLYKAWKWQKDVGNLVNPDQDVATYKQWWERGRISPIGIDHIHVAADGTAMPSKYIRQNKHSYGNFIKEDWQTLYENMAAFNKATFSQAFLTGVTTYDVRQRTIAADPNIYTNKPFKEVN